MMRLPIRLVCALAIVASCTYDYAALQGTGSSPIKEPKDGGRDAAGGSSLDGGARKDAQASVDSLPTADVGALGGGGRGAATGGDGPAGGASGGGGAGATGGAGTGGAVLGGSGGQGGAATGGAGGKPGTGGAGGRGGSAGAGGRGGRDPGSAADLVLRYAFEEKSGTVVNDTSGAASGPRNGALATTGSAGNASFSSNKVVGSGALALKGNGNGAGGYVTIPAPKEVAPTEMTFALWVNVTSDANYQRVFDFGTGTSKYMFLSTNGGDGRLRFAISSGGISGEQRLIAPVGIALQAWHHVAVVLSAGTPYTATMYLDGAPVVSNASMTLHPADLGITTNNYLGRSAYAADPYFNGVLDDFRVYRRALTASEIVALFGVRD